MSDRPVLILLYDILESTEKIENYVSGINFQSFSENSLIRDAVERNIEIIGEAVVKLPEEFKSSHNSIQRHKPVGMHNRLIHGYFAVDIPMLWNTITKILPDFKTEIGKLIENEEKGK
jgi:uncharacterized protein with HEPN domain